MLFRKVVHVISRFHEQLLSKVSPKLERRDVFPPPSSTHQCKAGSRRLRQGGKCWKQDESAGQSRREEGKERGAPGLVASPGPPPARLPAGQCSRCPSPARRPRAHRDAPLPAPGPGGRPPRPGLLRGSARGECTARRPRREPERGGPGRVCARQEGETREAGVYVLCHTLGE